MLGNPAQSSGGGSRGQSAIQSPGGSRALAKAACSIVCLGQCIGFSLANENLASTDLQMAVVQALAALSAWLKTAAAVLTA
jgi:hypothetical protein